MDIKKLVNKIVKKYNTNNPFDICKEMNIIVIETFLGKKTRGFYQYLKRNHVIYLDLNLEYEEKKMVLSHELGHALMHKDINAIFLDTRTFLKTSYYEKDADTFATMLLISDEDLLEYINYEYTIENIANIYGCSQELIKLRLKYLDKDKIKSIYS